MNLLIANLHNDLCNNSLYNMQHLQFPTGLATIAGAIIKKRYDNIYVVDNYVSHLLNEDIFNCIGLNKIDCILMSSYLGNYQYLYLKNIVSELSEKFSNIKIIVGGPLATTIPELLQRNVVAGDRQLICVIGEGEDTVIDLLSCIENNGDLNRVAGISFKIDGNIVTTRARKRIKSLTVDNFPSYDLFEMEKYVDYVKTNGRCWEISASRGCYNRCSYCKIVFGNNISFFSTKSIVQEMESVYDNYGISHFNFTDDNFLNSEQQVLQFVNELQYSDIKFSWRFQGRVDKLDPGLVEKMRQVGLFGVSLGIESGSEVIIQEMNKNLDLKQAKTVINHLNDQDITVHASFIVGMPSESPDTIQQTLNFIASAKPINVNAGILTLFPGTALYNHAIKTGIIEDEDSYLCNLGPVYTKPYTNLTKYSDEAVVEWLELIKNA